MPSEDAETPNSAAKSVELEVVEDAPPRLKRGRPITLTLRRFVAVCRLIEAGHSATAACEIQQISYCRFRARVAASSRLAERLKKATDTRFDRRHEEALAIVMTHAQRNWTAAAWFLERTLPQFYSARILARPDSSEKSAEEEIPSEVLQRHRQLLLELARQDEQQAKLTQGQSAA